MAMKAGGPTKRGLLIGINDYVSLPALRGSVNDVRLMAKILQRNFGFPAGNLQLLLDAEATRRNILAEMDRMLHGTKPDDIVVLYFSGMGTQVRAREAEPLVSVLAPYDAGRPSRPEGLANAVGYEEIRGWLRGITEVTPNVTVIIDSSHAGSLGGDAERYIYLAACRPEEVAYDHPAEGVPHGAFTHALSRALLGAGPSTTYRELFEQLSIQVSSRFPSQHPQMEGNGDRIIFGTSKAVGMRFVAVARRQRDAVGLAAGAAYGMTVRSLWAIYPSGTRRVTDASEKLGLVEISEVGATESTARILSEAGEQVIRPGGRAVEEMHHYGEMRLTVAVGTQPDAAGTRDILTKLLLESELLQLAEPSLRSEVSVHLVSRPADDGLAKLLREAEARGLMGSGEGSSMTTQLRSRQGGAWVVFDTETMRAAVPIVPADDPSARYLLRDHLERLARYRNVLGLRNPNVNSPLDGKVELALLRPAGGGWAPAEPDRKSGIPAFADGEACRIEVTNRHSEPVYVTVLDFPPDNSIAQVYPVAGGTAMLAPGQSVALDLKVYAPPELPFLPSGETMRKGSTVGVEAIKLFATAYPTDFSLLLLQDGFRWAKQQALGQTTALWQLLDMALTGHGSRETRPVTLPPEQEWTTVERSFALRR